MKRPAIPAALRTEAEEVLVAVEEVRAVDRLAEAALAVDQEALLEGARLRHVHRRVVSVAVSVAEVPVAF